VTFLSHPKCGASWEGYVIEEVSGLTPSMRIALQDLRLERLVVLPSNAAALVT
jgi:hypothetical protein